MMSNKSDNEILRELGCRLRAYRLQQNMPADQMAARAGLNRNTVGKAETGGDVRMSTVIRVLRVLGRLDALDSFLPPPSVSPMELLKQQGRTGTRVLNIRKRARNK